MWHLYVDCSISTVRHTCEMYVNDMSDMFVQGHMLII